MEAALSETLLSVRIQHSFKAPGHVAHADADFDLQFSLMQPWSVLFGPSGAGKSTVLRAIAGLLQPQAARIVFRGTRWTDTAARVFIPPHQRGIGYVGQRSMLFPHLTVLDNVRFGVRSQPDATRRCTETLELLQAAHLASRHPQELSGGEVQRVLLARALAPAPRLLLLDEPFVGLEMALRATLLDGLRSYLAEKPTPVLSVTHDVGEVFALNAEVTALHRGRVTVQGDAITVLAEQREQLLHMLNG